MRLILITNDPMLAVDAEAAGVHQIMVDMEVMGKAERQGHLDTHKAAHTINDVEAVARALSTAEAVVRTNPLHSRSNAEIEAAIEAGAKRLMQPMFASADEVRAYQRLVRDRVPLILLVETPQALAYLYSILPLVSSEDQIHFGLNDLSLGMALRNLFDVVAGRILDGPAETCRSAGISFGIGGVARIGSGEVPAELVLGEHARLGSSAAILSRAFHRGITSSIELSNEIGHLREVWEYTSQLPPAALMASHARFAAAVARVGVR